MKTEILKNLALITGTALITIILYHFWEKNENTEIPDKDRSLTTICMDYDNIAPATLTTGLIKSMVTKYDDTQLDYIQTATGTVVPADARAIWFDLETLKKFLYHLEHNVDKNYAEGANKKLGVRIYYSAYPDAKKMDAFMAQQDDPTYQFDPAYANLHTLIMIPTITGKDGQNFDFNPLDKTTYDGFSANNTRSLTTNPAYSTLSLSATRETTNLNSPNHTSARNHGMLSPPGMTMGFGF